MHSTTEWVEHHSTLSIIHGHKKPIIASCILPNGSLKTYAFVNGLPIEYRAFSVALCLAMSPAMISPMLSAHLRPNDIPRRDPNTKWDWTTLQADDGGTNHVITEEMYLDTKKAIDGITLIPDTYRKAFSNKHDLVDAIFYTVQLMFDAVKSPTNKESFDNFCNLIHTIEEDHQNSLVNPPMLHLGHQ